jgi:hypothetical protein
MVCLQVEIQNIGSMPWIADAQIRGHVRVGVQLLDSGRQLIDRDYARQPIAHDVPSGHTFSTNMRFKAPPTPGWYFLKVDLVSEGVSWFEAHGSAPTLHHLHVG